MAAKLSVQEIRADGKAELGRLDAKEVIVGREPSTTADSIVIPSDAISREHGIFSPLRSHWLYKDLGSTNGSWLNGIALKVGQWKLVRPGDVIQVADRAVQLSLLQDPEGNTLSGFGMPSLRSLLVFSRASFIDEYPIPEYGRALAIGGTKADLRLDVDVNELPSLVVERRGDRVCVFSIARESSIYVNDQEITKLVNLSDRDEIRISQYTILLNDPGSASITPGRGQFEVPSWESVPPIESVPIQERTTSGLFGTTDDREDESNHTIALDATSVQARLASASRERPPSMRHVFDESDQGTNYDLVGERIIAFVGWVFLLSLMIFMGWWLIVSVKS